MSTNEKGNDVRAGALARRVGSGSVHSLQVWFIFMVGCHRFSSYICFRFHKFLGEIVSHKTCIGGVDSLQGDSLKVLI